MRVILAVVLALASCSKSSESPAQAHAATTASDPNPAEAKRLIAGGAVVLDVRTVEEFEDGALTGATNIPLGDLGSRLAEVEKLAGADRTKPIVVYCRSGRRSTEAKKQLEAAGYTRIVNGGGLKDLR